ncbi:MAG: molybdopterin-dependent oxidoreductase [Geminicoccaceae bacterium]|nr:molybdopterin-dependent oxidoreductase [Geminicoccaceae bacterium]
MSIQRRLSLCHWGAFTASVENGRLVEAVPMDGSGADPVMIGRWPELVHSHLRIDRPHVRRRFLEQGAAAGGEGRGSDEMVPVDWDTALDLVASEIARIHETFGPQAIFGGSYGWSSAGRFHHARTQVRRFLASAGGFTDQVGNYSWGAAHALLPHVLGSAEAVSGAATGWESIAGSTDTLVAFGGLNPKNWRVTSGGAGFHRMPEAVVEAARNGVKFIIVSPHADDVPDGIDALTIRPRPNSDTAIMLALAREALVSGRADLPFLQHYTVGHEQLADYLHGRMDGVDKTLEWAATIADVPHSTLRELWHRIRNGRVMLTATWSLQRSQYGEQPYWALIALAAMLGQIGLPGGGFCFGYGSLNAVGARARKGFVPAMPAISNPANSAIPAASILDCLAHPGKIIAFNGNTLTFPDIRLVYWAGGNPFHHAQDLFALDAAWRRPQTVIVNEPWWTPAARRADIVLPATTSAERNDIGGTSRDPHVFAMPRLVPPQGEARDDFTIFAALAERLGCHQTFTEGLDEQGWLTRLWAANEARATTAGIDIPSLGELFAKGCWRVPPPDGPEVMLAGFRADPDAVPLATPSGRIELFSATIAGFGLDDVPGHPAWIEPVEWLGRAAADELHLVTNQPSRQLHSQLFQTRTDNGPARVDIAPSDAAARGIGNGAQVRLFNRRGACLAQAHVNHGLRPGVLAMPTGAWFAPDPARPHLERNGNPNVLTSSRTTSGLGQGCAALSTLVRIEPWNVEG